MIKRVQTVFGMCMVILSTSLASAQSRSKSNLGQAKLPAAPVETGLVIRPASDQPVEGYQQHVIEDGRVVYVAPAAVWTAADIVDVTEYQNGMTIRLTKEAVTRVAAGAHDRLAFLLDGHLMAVTHATQTTDPDAINVTGLLPGQTQRLGRLIVASPIGPAGPTIRAIPREIEVAAGASATVDIFVSGIAELRAFQVAVDVIAPQTGQVQMESLAVDTERMDFVFVAQQAVSAADESRQRLVGAMYAGGVIVNGPAYLGTYTFKISEDADGQFQVQVRSLQDSLLRDSEGLPVGFNVAAPATIKIGKFRRAAERQ